MALAQLEAVRNLSRFESADCHQALICAWEQSQFFYRVRIAAIHSLVTMANKSAATWSAAHTLVEIGRNMFSSGASTELVRSNDFSYLETYFMQKEYLRAISSYRNAQKYCADEIVSCILDWIKYNDNRRNHYSDAMYRSTLIEALSQTISPSATIVSTPDILTPGQSFN